MIFYRFLYCFMIFVGILATGWGYLRRRTGVRGMGGWEDVLGSMQQSRCAGRASSGS